MNSVGLVLERGAVSEALTHKLKRLWYEAIKDVSRAQRRD